MFLKTILILPLYTFPHGLSFCKLPWSSVLIPVGVTGGHSPQETHPFLDLPRELCWGDLEGCSVILSIVGQAVGVAQPSQSSQGREILACPGFLSFQGAEERQTLPGTSTGRSGGCSARHCAYIRAVRSSSEP